jgi:hypothetical protein
MWSVLHCVPSLWILLFVSYDAFGLSAIQEILAANIYLQNLYGTYSF